MITLSEIIQMGTFIILLLNYSNSKQEKNYSDSKQTENYSKSKQTKK